MSWKKRLARWLKPLDMGWDHFKRFLKTRRSADRRSPIQLMLYRGYGSSSRIWLKGRVLEDRLIVARREDSVWRNLVNTYKRFSSREIWGAELEVQLGPKTFRLETDREGYFELLTPTPERFPDAPATWLHPAVRLIRTPWAELNQVLPAEVLFPLEPQFAVISDIDDTIIRTGVTSRLMWRAIYRTILKNAGSRVLFREASALLRAMSRHRQAPGYSNPVFYVSNSPWNLYDLMNDFLLLHGLPKGPILLRDLGLPAEPLPDGYRGHKYENIARILDTYPQLPFVLIGDSGERDTDIYLEITQHFPDRIKAIYIRDVQHQGRTRRVQELIRKSGRTEVLLLNHFGEAVAHAESLDLLSQTEYVRLMEG